MSNSDALKELLAKIEAGDGERDDWWYDLFGASWTKAQSAFYGSLDAAKALHDAVLPVAKWQVWHDNAEVWFDGPKDYSEYLGKRCYPHNPARSWLIAIIKALIAQEKDNDQ